MKCICDAELTGDNAVILVFVTWLYRKSAGIGQCKSRSAKGKLTSSDLHKIREHNTY
jgi:hypothetical protein